MGLYNVQTAKIIQQSLVIGGKFLISKSNLSDYKIRKQ